MYSIFMENDKLKETLLNALMSQDDETTVPEELVNKPESQRVLRGDIHFGKTLLYPYRCNRISIVESVKWGFRELHLHGLYSIKTLDEVVDTYYREGLEKGFDPIERPDLYKKKETLQITVSNLFCGEYNEGLKDYVWMPFERVIRFFGHETQRGGDHYVFKPADLGDTLAQITRNLLNEQSFLRRILPPNPIS